MRELDRTIKVSGHDLAFVRCFSNSVELTDSAYQPGLRSFRRHRSLEYQSHQSATVTWIAMTCSRLLLDASEKCITKSRRSVGPLLSRLWGRSSWRHNLLARPAPSLILRVRSVCVEKAAPARTSCNRRHALKSILGTHDLH